MSVEVKGVIKTIMDPGLKVICIILGVFLNLAWGQEACNKLYFEEDSFVCVCNEAFCDNFPTISTPPQDHYVSLTTSRDEHRFLYALNAMTSNSTLPEPTATISINSSNIMQSMLGFGAAFTDSTGINIRDLSEPLQETVVRQYFSPDGLEYNIGRIPIAGCDFSTHPYSYDDVEGDIELQFFNLTEEDHLYKIPFIKKAKELSEKEIKLYATPWSPPSWMKENGMFNGSGGLLPEMQQPWANYFVKFLEAYEQEGVTLWGLTIQNEPSAGTTNYAWNACHFTSEEERDFLKGYLGPTLTASGYRFLKLMVGDDSRYIYPGFVETILNDAECYDYSDGVAVHWYTDSGTPASVLNEIHDQFPEKFILYTEACAGYVPFIGNHVALGSWSRGEDYASNIINNVNHWSSGWTDWNMALDMIGGPNWATNYVDAPIIINKDSNEFYKQPMFYALGHFSKYILEGSKRIGSSVRFLGATKETKIGPGSIDAVSFLDPTGRTVIVILNKNDEEATIAVTDTSGNLFSRTMPAKSIETIIYVETM